MTGVTLPASIRSVSTQSMLQPFPLNAYPNLADFITEHAMKPGYDFADEFEYGLDLVLDGIERAVEVA